MNLPRPPDLAVLLFVLLASAAFGALFAWVLQIPFWLGMAMVGAGFIAAGVRDAATPLPRRRPAPLRAGR
ncbi:MAG: hypothetical protein KGZ52_05755 [Xanthomonadaceae bacterium]|jgi:hypothetical protein|nr:hypothetical protein [Xanthomonadaceae bacterium]